MSSPNEKRPAEEEEEEETAPSSKRQKVHQPAVKIAGRSSVDEEVRLDLRRSIALTLQHVGFDSSVDSALDSFATLAETYLQSLIADVTQTAQGSRRIQPTPADFDSAIAHFNLEYRPLKRHKRHPIPKAKLRARYHDPLLNEPIHADTLPPIAPELSGKPDKDAKPYIPSSFPDFPSVHTYKYSPEDLENVTVKGSGLRWDDGTPISPKSRDHMPEGPRGDPQKVREAAAKEATQAEEALRGLVRASKINALKEVRAVAERNPLSNQRYSLWESAMRELIDDPAGGRGPGHVDATRVDIADHSMMVNAEKKFHRKEVQRMAKKTAQKV